MCRTVSARGASSATDAVVEASTHASCRSRPGRWWPASALDQRDEAAVVDCPGPCRWSCDGRLVNRRRPHGSSTDRGAEAPPGGSSATPVQKGSRPAVARGRRDERWSWAMSTPSGGRAEHATDLGLADHLVDARRRAEALLPDQEAPCNSPVGTVPPLTRAVVAHLKFAASSAQNLVPYQPVLARPNCRWGSGGRSGPVSCRYAPAGAGWATLPTGERRRRGVGVEVLDRAWWRHPAGETLQRVGPARGVPRPPRGICPP